MLGVWSIQIAVAVCQIHNTMRGTVQAGRMVAHMRSAFFWIFLFTSKNVSEWSFLPEAIRLPLVRELANVAAFFRTQPAVLDEYLGCDSLARAIEVDDEAEVRRLIHKYPLAANTPWLGVKALEYAVKMSSRKAVGVLLSLNTTQPCNLLKHCNNISMLQVLIGRGADLMKHDEDGRSCVDSAALRGNLDIALAMIRYGARPSSKCLEVLRRRSQDDFAESLECCVNEVKDNGRFFVGLVLFRSCNRIVSTKPVIESIYDYLDL